MDQKYTTHSQTEATGEVFEGPHSFRSQRNVDGVACHDKLVLSDHSSSLKFETMAVRVVVCVDQLWATWHYSICVSPFEI